MDFIYIHRGYSWYVPLALRNARRFCRGTVHYLGDPYGCLVARLCGARTARIRDYRRGADRFAGVYRHHSTLGHDFELFCIQRWFMLHEYMEANGMPQAIYLDTDNLVCRPLDEYVSDLGGCGLSFTGYSAHICFILKRETLKEFCRFAQELYLDGQNEEKLAEWETLMKEKAGGGGVSDMTLFYWFHERHPDLAARYEDIFEESPFDVSMDDVRNWKEDEHGLKFLDWQDSIPSACRKQDGRLVGQSTLHHQGRAKKMICGNFRRLHPGVPVMPPLLNLLETGHRLGRKIIPNL